MILASAMVASIGQLAAWHRHERTFRTLDDLQVANDICIVERHRAEGLQALVLVVIFHELDTDFGDDHVCSPMDCGTFKSNFEPQRHEHFPHNPLQKSVPVKVVERRRRL